MSTFKSDPRTEKSSLIGSCGIFLLLAANFEFVAASVTWTSPLPVWTQTVSNDIRTVNMSVRIGSTQVPLRWNYTLSPGSVLVTTTFSIDDGTSDDIGAIFHTLSTTSVNDRNDYRTRFAISTSEVATLIMKKVTEREEAVYQCKLSVVGNTWAYNIRVIVTVPAELTNKSGDQMIQEGKNMTLFCEASGKPTPNITWTRVLEDGSNGEMLHQGPTWKILGINRTVSGAYRCTAYNGIGNAVGHKVKVNVTYPAKILNVTASRNEVAVQQSVSLVCEAEGNPPPSYTWTPCEMSQSFCHSSVHNISEVLKDGVYICAVRNTLGEAAGNVSVFIAGNVINVTLVITNEKCVDGKYNQSSLWKNLNKLIDNIFVNTSEHTGAQLKNVRCGRKSVIVELELNFRFTIRESEVINILRDAARSNKFGKFQVNASSIVGTRPEPGKATTITPTTPNSPSDSKKTWIIVGVVLGIVAVLVVVAIVVACLYKKRKCNKKDTKVHNDESQVQATDEYAEVNRGYAPQGSNHNSRVSNPSSVPPVSYAVVDKTKKKKREKKTQPGELQYAELAELSRAEGMPRTSASRGSYPTETQYADVSGM